MLNIKHRLKKKKDFEKAAKAGKTIGSPALMLKFSPNNLEASRIGFVVSKKISNKAVVRNKVKRRLREAMRIFLPQLKPGFDLVFFTRSGIEKMDFEQVKQVVEKLLTRADLIYGN